MKNLKKSHKILIAVGAFVLLAAIGNAMLPDESAENPEPEATQAISTATPEPEETTLKPEETTLEPETTTTAEKTTPESETTTTIETTTATEQTTPAATTTPIITTTPRATTNPDDVIVFTPTNGGKYHRAAASCGMEDSYSLTIGEARAQGIEPCGRCY